MVKLKFLSAALLSAAVFTASAHAQEAGTVSGVSGDVLVVRGADVIPLKEGDSIFPGDRIMTRGDASVNIQTGACNVSVGGASSIVVDAQICTKTPIQLTQADQSLLQGAGGSGAGGGGILGGGGVGAAAGLGGAAVVAGAVVANNTGGGSPASP